MKSIERKFKKIQERNPYWSSYVCFFFTVKGRNFSRQTIARWFNKLVEKDDYSSSDKKSILTDLYAYTKPPEDNQK